MELNEGEKSIRQEDLALIRDISEQYWAESGSPMGQIIKKDLFFNILLALLLSIPIPNFFEFLAEKDENSANDWLKTRYEDLLNLRKVDFSSRDLKKKIEGKFFYYERAFKIRCEIQSYSYDYHGLDKTAANFIRARETIRAQKEQKDSMGLGKEECYTCGAKWLKEKKGFCKVCEEEKQREAYIVIAGFFNVIGDSNTFWNNLGKDAEDALSDHWKEIKAFMQNERNRKKSLAYVTKVRKYGEKQYKEIIKPNGEEPELLDKDLIEFNRKYGVALLQDAVVVNLTDSKNAFDKDFIYNLCMLDFPLCEKLSLPPRHIDINDLKPKMPQLIELRAENCKIKQIELDANFFPKLRRIYLNNNEIEDEMDFRNLNRIKNLKLIVLAGNPIERKDEIWAIKKKWGDNHIEIRLHPQREFPSYKHREEESDSSIAEGMEKFKDCFDSQSLASKSIE